MFSKILYPTDFSDVSQKALAYIKSLKGAGAKTVIVLRVINEKKAECISRGVAWSGMEVADFLKESYRILMDEAKTEVAPIESELKEAGFDVEVMVERGVPQLKILEIAEEKEVSVIILGSHGRSNLASALLGSVSDHVIRHARQPVIVIKRD
jgi:nucleotide-binding universal stress UspA family protein